VHRQAPFVASALTIAIDMPLTNRMESLQDRHSSAKFTNAAARLDAVVDSDESVD
jgi:hypothetical protein